MTLDATVSLRDAPRVAGLRFRPYRGPQDCEALAAVHAGSAARDRVDPLSAREHVYSADELRTMLAGVAPGSPDVLVADVDGTVVGYNHALWRWTEVTGARVYLHLGYLLPAWRGRGIGGALLRWSQARIRAIAAEEPPAAGPRFLATNVSSTQPEADALVRGDGYAAVRRLSDMALDLAGAPTAGDAARPLPAGVDVRGVTPEQYPAIYAAWTEAFAEVWTSTPAGEEDYREFLEEKVEAPGFDPALCRVAWAGDTAVGMVWIYRDRGVATVLEVAVRPAWRRRGIARALLADALRAIRAYGIMQVRLFTDADNGQGARSLYESRGFRELKQHSFYRRPLEVPPPHGEAAEDDI